MKNSKLSAEEVELLNTKVGLYTLLKKREVQIDKVLSEVKYEMKLREYQEEMIKLQNWVIETGQKVVVIFEGRDAAGKGGAIRRITKHINPRHFRIIALDKPTEDERRQWFFQRYINHLPKPGEIVFFDRSWYNRAVVEPVNGFCTPEEYNIFMSQVNAFERMLIDSNTFLIKFYFSISKEEQKRRFDDIVSSPLKRWKMTPVDAKAQELWDEYTKYKEVMLNDTSSEHAPWIRIDADEKTHARLQSIKHILNVIPYAK
ncbi:polyphosphate kinase 2 [Phaeocystidibacter marisrubri]|uniref:ADP/GDP-polyphosphate phosphotransferase n=1 Tax=Phaeocystidibacter marisrubri TaxID=1577780 RepID=A0A6L3ZJJ7_9FLAO|nr:polyphosphate kinase 2 [Phaeocystidibacter marisrubri]KAB2817997.1 polyphosphate kinase 2 [Phaeocystidibacter marisrubri]GGH72479.1 polyphosphate kinase 2 [Phaeocystidibacter marisrubri]